MRPIKFRALSLNRRKWHYGVPLEYSRDNGYSTTVIVRDINGCGYEDIANMKEVIPDTIGQFTGLADKNGTEIYEGDIVEYKYHKYVVKFQNGMFYASVHELQSNVFGGFPLHTMTTNADNGGKCVIIENIHDKINEQ